MILRLFGSSLMPIVVDINKLGEGLGGVCSNARINNTCSVNSHDDSTEVIECQSLLLTTLSHNFSCEII